MAAPGTSTTSTSEGAPLSLSGAADLTLTRVLGQGGMGVVFEARQAGLERALAVKTLHPHLARGAAAEKFLAEAATTARLEHPNIVPVHMFGRDGRGRPFICMQVIRGVEWAALIAPRTDAERERARGVDLAAHLGILRRACDAVAFAHAEGVIHRDLKPENVMIGAHGEALVTDWGIALPLAERAPAGERRPVVGTPAYLPPEMARGDESAQSPRTDVYLLGGILYELLTGTPPHRGGSVFEVLLAAGEGAVEPAAARAKERAVPPELAAIAARALEADPARRHEDARAFAAALDGYTANQASQDLAREALGRLASLEAAGATEWAARQAGLASVVSDLEQALAMWPGNDRAREGAARARVASAVAALAQGDLGAAEAHLARVPEGAPGLGAARALLAGKRAAREAERRRARRLAAVVVATALVAALLSWLALREAGRAGAAEEAGLRRRRAIEAIDGTVWMAPEAQIAAYARSVALDPSFTQSYIDLAGCYTSRAYARRIVDPPGCAQDLEEARAVLSRLLGREPANGPALYLRGWCSEMLGELDRARPDYVSAVALIPDTHDGKATATILALADRRLEDAERLATESIERGGDGDDMSHRAYARYALGRTREGLADFRRAEVHSGGGDGDFDAQTALFLLALGDGEGAAARLISAVRREPLWPRAYGLLAWLAARRGDAETARALRAYALERWRVHARCYPYVEPKLRTVSFAPGEAGRLGRAILLEEDLEAALPAAPGEGQRLRAEGEERLRAGDLDAALAKARRALALDPTDGPALLLRGRALARLGLLEAAKDDLSLAALLAPQMRAQAEAALAEVR